MGKNRGVCPECGFMTPWFRIRLYGGCFGIILAVCGILALFLWTWLAGAPTE